MVKGVKLFAACIVMLCLLTVSTASAQILTSPAQGSQLTALPTFTWTKVAGQQWNYVFVGQSVGTYEYACIQLTDNTTSLTVPGLPSDNSSTVYLRIYAFDGSQMTYNDYSFKARAGNTPDEAVMTLPATSGATTNGNFAWTSVTGVWYYLLTVGTSAMGYDIAYRTHQSGQTTDVLYNLPSNTPIYVTLYTVMPGGVVVYRTYNYNTVYGLYMTSPATEYPTRLAAPAVFTWTDAAQEEYVLYYGTTQGSFNLGYYDGPGTIQTVTQPGFPTDNSTIWIRLHGRTGTNWTFTDYHYKAAGTFVSDIAQITNPAANGGTLDNSTGSCKFEWTSKAYASYYYLQVGSSVGGAQYYAGDQGTNTSVYVPGLPSGTTVYTRLYTVVGANNVAVPVDNSYVTP